MYEASTAGGIPIIGALKNGLSANHILSIQGIMNGTTNYMLTKMIKEGAEYASVLKEAQIGICRRQTQNLMFGKGFWTTWTTKVI